MDIRTFFNAEYSKLQTTNNNVSKELEKTSKILDEQINQFETVNNILRGMLRTKTKQPLKGAEVKEVNKLKQIQKKLVSSISKIVEPKKPDKVVREEKKSALKITSAKFLFPHLRIENASFSKVNLYGFKPEQTAKQSSQDFYRTDDKSNDFQKLKIEILKRIDANLTNSPKLNVGDAKEEKDSGGFFGNIGGMISSALGGGIIATLIAKYFPTLSKAGGLLKGAAKIGSKAGGLLKGAAKLGGKVGLKALPIVGAVMSIYDLVKGVKTGLSDYSKYSDAGDKLAAQGALSSMLMNTLGNTINVVGSFLPGPLGIALFALGTSMTLVSDKMKETKGRTSGYVGEAREKVAKTEQLIDVERSKGTMVELRPNFSDYKNIYWEYNSGDEWKPIVDSSTGKYLSAMNGRNPIVQSTDPKLPGIQTYKLNTKTGGQREIVVENGNIYMMVPNVGKVAISTRKTGGPVVRNKTYVVGERQPETYVPNVKQNREVEKKIDAEREALKKQQMLQKREIDKKFEVFFEDIKKIRSFFSSNVDGVNISPNSNSQSLGAGSSSTLSTADTTTQQLAGVQSPTQYVTKSLGAGAKKTMGARYNDVKAYLTEASTSTGVPLESLVKMAHSESGLLATAGAKTSSAKGLFQFIGGTWKSMLKTHGKKYGLTPDADVYDPRANALMGAEYIKMNMLGLRKSGFPTTVQNLYLAHFLGLGGARKFLKAFNTNNLQDSTISFPKEAAANKTIFYSKDGTPRTLQGIYDILGKKMAVDVSYMNSFDIGSWKIDRDQEAFVHKGEMIVPEYHANKIRTAAKSGRMEITQPEILEEYDIYSDSNFWINTFMPALANVVKTEFGGE